ncbi:MAG TPA: DUF1552 domain-containing protein [Polyangiaceae bacterium]|nr:DUF1552 domain-containing protein [Polyangiaceae bacterium]
MSNVTPSRRRFLQSLGISAAAIPLVVGLDSLYAKADVPTVPKKRFLFMYSPNGGLYYNFRLRVHAPETDISDGTALAAPNLIYHPLQANAKKLLVLDRLSWIGAREIYQSATAAPDHIDHPGGHQKGLGSLLTGQILTGGTQDFGNAGLADGISLDQYIATKLFAGKTKFQSLEVGVQVDENLSDRYVDKRVSYDAPATPRAPQNDPFVLFNTLFGAPGMGSSDQALRQMLDKSVLDSALADFTRLNTKLSKDDQMLLQAHADSLRGLEKQLGTVVNCGMETPPAAPTGVSITDASATHKWAMTPDNYPTVGGMMMDIIVQAMACGLTNIVTMMWRNSENDLELPFLTDIDYTKISLGHHGMSHARDPGLVAIDQWYATQFNTLVSKFDAIPDSGTSGTLLDNSLLMWSSCLGDASSHVSNNVPVILAGSNGGYFKQGKNIQFNDVYTASQWAGDPLGAKDGAALTTAADASRTGDQQTVGTPDLSNNDLAVSILNSFGMTDTTFGDPRFCKGALPNIKA